MKSGKLLRLGTRITAVIGVLFAVLAVRAVTSSRAELLRGDTARERGDADAAILFYRRAARWYTPGDPCVPEALDRLAMIAREAEEEGDTERALAAWRSVRGAILATRSFYIPHRGRLERAEREIVDATASLAEPRVREAARQHARAALGEPTGPVLLFTLVLLVGWLAWTGGAFAFTMLVIDEEDRVRAKPARIWGTVIVVGFGLFVLGMALA